MDFEVASEMGLDLRTTKSGGAGDLVAGDLAFSPQVATGVKSFTEGAVR
jgi:hypothetical protein